MAQAVQEVVAVAVAYAPILTMAYEHGKQARCVVLQQDEVPPAAAARYALVSGLLRAPHRAMDELEAEAFVAQPAAITYLHFS